MGCRHRRQRRLPSDAIRAAHTIFPSVSLAELKDRVAERHGARAFGLLAALAIEALLIALLLMIGMNDQEPLAAGPDLVSFSVEDAQQPEEETDESDTPPEPDQQEAAERAPDDLPPPPQVPQENSPDPTPAPRRPRLLEISPDSYRSSDIANLPRNGQNAAPQRAYGPQGSAGSPDDTPIVGTAPNGEPMYAARWYREPSDHEMRGYLSTANPDSWALITCRTAPKWRVEDCVGLEEFPQGSNVLRAALAAAWQYEVRPPRRGNQSLVGSWVRIRIEYTRSRSG